MSAAARNQGDKIGVSGYRLNVVINQLWRRQKYALSLSLSLYIYIYIYIYLFVCARARVIDYKNTSDYISRRSCAEYTLSSVLVKLFCTVGTLQLILML